MRNNIHLAVLRVTEVSTQDETKSLELDSLGSKSTVPHIMLRMLRIISFKSYNPVELGAIFIFIFILQKKGNQGLEIV